MDPQTQEVGRFYTQIRRFKKKLGKFHDGTRIPGGPYSMTQGLVALVFLFGLLWTHPLWTRGQILSDLLMGALIVWGAAWLSGKLPVTKRNPLTVAVDAFSATVAPLTGKYQGIDVKIRPPHRAYNRGSRTRPQSVVSVPIPDPVPQQHVEPQDPHTPVPFHGSAVQRLLAQANQP